MRLLDLNHVNLLVFDECHHGVKDQPMRQVMRSFQKLNKPPRVLGLTATLLNANCKPQNVMSEVCNLEVTYQSKVATVEELQEVVGFVKLRYLFFFSGMCKLTDLRRIPVK